MRSYGEGAKVKQEVIHLGQHSTVDAAPDLWSDEIKELKKTRPNKAKKLQGKLERLRELIKK